MSGTSITSEATAPNAAARTVHLGGHVVTVVDDYPTFWARADAGTWEAGALRTQAKLIAEDALFIDLGAWIGPTSLHAAACGARVIAVEADPAAAAVLKKNVAANHELTSRITIIERAVAATSAPVTFGARRKAGDSMASMLLAETATLTWTTPAVTPAEIAALIGPGERPVIKMDLEGAEYDVLPAFAPLLAHPRATALVSFHPRILAEARPGTDRASLEQAALAPFSGWLAQPVGDFGTGRAIAVQDLLSDPDWCRQDQWLFSRGGLSS
ncbi:MULTISPECIES: FkbM family methyltransferase [unclassified Chelatococcus]|uniref:FkbM family methyltransferase n=1 Tax=unclassified Chelatococcus TaxID=2638111 RepID=UPI001BD0536B|nr:FkbM family methyltransferase [Chelatococcus sp.]MBS7698423.1 FkbM family methyltransferase [Chelatococcus sp. YT9]MBX3559499.1 FkbM family methyltransferase [Chelatococcus sp.]